MTSPASVTKLPFREAIDFFKSKLPMTTEEFRTLDKAHRDRAFVVSGATQTALLEDLYNAVAHARDEGLGYPDFRERFREITGKHGWAYDGKPAWRSRLVYDTNVTQSYNAGRYKQMMSIRHLRPYWRYRHTSFENPRLIHKGWDGMVVAANHPWWNTHFPQNGFLCKCKVDALSKLEAEREWKKRGKTGPDTPEIEWDKKTIGKTSDSPHTIRIPKGIDPGFGFNPGKVWLEPHTIPHVQGARTALKKRKKPWPADFTPPSVPGPTKLPEAALLSKDTRPEEAVDEFLSKFGADMESGTTFRDATGTGIAITKALFQDEKGEFGWLAYADNTKIEYMNLLADAIIAPDEIWWIWARDESGKKRWRLNRRYLKAFEIEGRNEYGIVAFEWGRKGWKAALEFIGKKGNEMERNTLFERMRDGKLMFSRETQN
uniref:Phage Mu protein F like protein n=1 Tax=Candidatus Kentrum sp. LFY TaxID=2126342 RepID=A0A450V4N1_9GAMM|nr:MAG: Phage Mu protein F like protein [Candidatus Kentron sp. LFY]